MILITLVNTHTYIHTDRQTAFNTVLYDKNSKTTNSQLNTALNPYRLHTNLNILDTGQEFNVTRLINVDVSPPHTTYPISCVPAF